MQFPAVNWHEGLFLQPHHFQAWDRHWTERVSVGERWQAPHAYGVLELSFNRDAMAVGFLQVDVLRCKTPGGALIDCPSGQISQRRDLRSALEIASNREASAAVSDVTTARASTAHVDILVGVPRLQLGAKNVVENEQSSAARFRPQLLELPDELDAACIKPVELRQLNAKILLSTDDLAGYDLLTLARVRRSGEDEVQVRFDTQYIPPLMDCSAWPLMHTEILSSIVDLVQNISERFVYQLLDAGGTLQTNSPIEVQRLLTLQTVHPAVSVLKLLTHTPGIHPLTAYVELARLAGSLDLLHPQRVAKPTPAYDHENLGPIFFELKRRILSNIESLEVSPYRQIGFTGYQHGMQLTVDPAYLSSHRRWFIGFHKGDQNTGKILSLMAPGNLDWKLGSLKQVESLFTGRADGLQLRHVSSPPASLPRSDHWIYFEIDTAHSSLWADVLTSGSLGLRVADSMVANRHSLPGSREIQLKQGGESFALRLALFGSA